MTNSVTVTIYSMANDLQILGTWGNIWDAAPGDISAHNQGHCKLSGSNRGGIWYRVINPSTKEEVGFATMSFTSPSFSPNSAEGSPNDGIFISSGLQQYSESGSELKLTYKVGMPNLACWTSGNSNNGIASCEQTKFSEQRLRINLSNPNGYQLKLEGYWNDNMLGDANWYWEPSLRDIPPANCSRTTILKDNDRAGLYLRVSDQGGDNTLGYSMMSFTNPRFSSLSAEGSNADQIFMIPAGLQVYQSGAACIKYHIGQVNMACWTDGQENNGSTECPQTALKDRRALIAITNKGPETLNFSAYWNDNNGGKSNWYFEPTNIDDNIKPECSRFFVLKDNDRAGLQFKQEWLEFHMSFTSPVASSNSAEGSPFSGLQTYSSSGTPATFRYIAGTSNLACWTSGNSNNGRIACSQTLVLPFDLPRWMGKINAKYPARFSNQELRKLFIPGTHDAACYNFSSVATPWVQTQNLDFHDQLMKGVRYFDLRPSFNFDSFSGDHFNGFSHGDFAVGARLSDLIQQITTFYREDWDGRKYEIVLLDFTHFSGYGNVSKMQGFFDEIANSTLQQYLIPQGAYSAITKLDTLWTASDTRRVIASVPAPISQYSNITNIWNGSDLYAPGWSGGKFWPDTKVQQTLIDFIDGKVLGFNNEINLWVLQDVLTPGVTSSVYSLAGEAHAALYATSVPGRKRNWNTYANVLIQDYYDERTTIEAIIENIRRISP